MKDYKKWALEEVDKYVEAHALDSDPEKLMDLQLALDLFCLYLEKENDESRAARVKSFFCKFMDGMPLTPIDISKKPNENPDEWALIRSKPALYQSNRLETLFYRPELGYSDIRRVICIDAGSGEQFVDRSITKLVDANLPIKFPYMGDDKVIVMVIREAGDGWILTDVRSARRVQTGEVYDINAHLLKIKEFLKTKESDDVIYLTDKEREELVNNPTQAINDIIKEKETK